MVREAATPESAAPRVTMLQMKTFESAAGEEDLRIVLERVPGKPFDVSGTVRDGLTGRPIELFEVFPMHWRGMRSQGERVEVESADGSFVLEDLAPGDWTLRVRAEGYVEESVELPGSDGRSVELAIDLFPLREVLLEVVGAAGNPIVGTGVSILDAAGEPLVLRGADMRSPMLLTDEAGRLRVQDLPARVLTLVLYRGATEQELQRSTIDLRENDKGTLRRVVEQP